MLLVVGCQLPGHPATTHPTQAIHLPPMPTARPYRRRRAFATDVGLPVATHVGPSPPTSAHLYSPMSGSAADVGLPLLLVSGSAADVGLPLLLVSGSAADVGLPLLLVSGFAADVGLRLLLVSGFAADGPARYRSYRALCR
jgi:hypothetical protein